MPERYTLKERYDYHKTIADGGKLPDGSKVGFTSRVRHAKSAIKVHNKLNAFMAGVNCAKIKKK